MKTLSSGIKIDAPAVARGVFDMMPDDDKACMVVGMLPKNWMDIIEQQVREKLAGDQFHGQAAPSTIKLFAKAVKKEIVEPIIHEIAVALLKVAVEEGICKV